MIQADPNRYYNVFRAGLFPYYSWETGDWKKFEITKDYAKSVADCYDGTIHKAPAWIGHPWGGAGAMGWIANAKYDNGEILNSFEWIDEELIKAVKDKRYQYVSVEFGRVMDVDNDYQVALGITNVPRVSKQKPLDFEHFEKEKSNAVYVPITNSFSIDLVNDYASNKKFFFQNQNINSMNEFLKKLALLFSIDLTAYNTDESVVNKITESFSALSNSKASLEAEVKSLKDSRTKYALDNAIEKGQIKPAERESYESLLNGNFEAAHKVITGLPVNPALSANSIAAGGVKSEAVDPSAAPAGDKFSNADGSKMNYEQFLEKVSSDPQFAKQFSNDEIYSLPGAERFTIKGDKE